MKAIAVVAAVIALLAHSVDADPGSPVLPCAATALKVAAPQTDGGSFAEVRALKNAGQYPQALAKLKETIKAHPEWPVPADIQDLTDPFAAAKALSRARMHDAAQKELERVLKTGVPPARAVPDELTYLTGSVIVDLARRHQWVLAALFGAAILLIPLILRRRLHPRLHVEDLADPATISAGRGASFYLQQQLVALTSAEASTVQFVTAPITEVTIPAAISSAIPSAFGWLKTVLSVFSIVYWRRSLTLTGTLHAAIDEKGVGLTLVLSENKTILNSASLWQSDCGTTPPAKPSPKSVEGAASDPSPYFDLAEPAAIWLLFQLLQIRFGELTALRRLMGTDDWKSYAMNAAGVRARWKNPRRSEDFLVKALRIDPKNAAARANLGTALQIVGQFDRALEQLRFAKREAPAQEGGTHDPVFYAARYRIALIYYLQGSRQARQQCLDEITALAKVMNETQKSAALRRAGDRERVLHYIAFIAPAVNVMRLAVEAELGKITATEAHTELLAYKLHPTPEAQYNLACAYVVLAGVTNLESEKLTFLRYAMDALEFTLHLEPRSYDQASSDPSLEILRRVNAKAFDEAIASAKKAVAIPDAPSETPQPAPPASGAPPVPDPAAATATAALLTVAAAGLSSYASSTIVKR